jgi:hypothetical protein
MTGLECNTNFTVGFESADAGPVSRARIDDDERA